MAQPASSKELTVVGVRAQTIALFEGTLAGAIGIAVAIIYALRVTINLTSETSSVLAGLTFGIGTGTRRA